MTRYRKLPTEVEAIQFMPNSEHWDWNELTEFFGIQSGKGVWQSFGIQLNIRTPEGYMKVLPTDWIIKGIEGEFYPCKNSIFEKTYEQV